MGQMSTEGQDLGGGNDQGQSQEVVDNNQQQTEPSTVNVNPAWNDVLQVIPQQMHSQITPHFQKWDQNYQQSIQKVHSQYEPWKQFIDNGVDPGQVDFSLGLLNAISTNPQEVMTALQEWIDSEEGGGQQGSFEQQGQFDQTQHQEEPGFDPNDITSHPKFQEMEQAVQTMAQLLLGEREKEQQAQQDAELETELNTLRESKGDFDEEYVISLCANNENMTLEQAVDRYHQLTEQILSGKRQPGPPVLGSGGAFPNSSPETRKLGSKDTKNLVAQMLQQSFGNGGNT